MKINSSAAIKLSAFIFIFFYHASFGQSNLDYRNLRFDYFNTDNGLSNNNVSCFLQDKKGFMWIGTSSGLNRFDGYSFKVFHHDPSDSTSIAAGDINCLYEDDSGYIWIGTGSGGLNRLDPRTEKFKAWMHSDTVKNSIPGNSIKSICAAPNNCLWLASNNGVIYFDPLHESFKTYLHNEKDSFTLSKNDITSVSLLGEMLWIGTYDKGINILNTKTEKIKRLPLIAESSVNGNWNYTRQFIKYNDTLIVVASGFGIIGVNPFTLEQTQLVDSLDPVQFIKDKNGWLWMGCRNGGLMIFNPITKEHIDYNSTNLNQPSVIDINVFAVLESRDGTFWLGKNLSGMQRTNPSAQKFRVLQSSGKEYTGGTLNYMMNFAEDDSNLWVGLFSAGFHQFRKTKDGYKFIKNFNNNNLRLGNQFPICMTMGTNDELWQGHFSFGGGVFCFNTKTHKLDSIRRYKTDGDNAISENNCTAILPDKDILWIGTPRMGIDRYDRRTKTFTHYRNDKNNPQSFSGTWVHAIRKLNNDLYIGSNGGLSKLNADGTFTNYTHNDTNVFSMGGSEVTCMNFDNAGRLWAGTSTGDMNIFSPELKKFLHVKLFSGKKKTSILGLLIDNAGKIWMSTDAGISTFTPPQNLDSYFERKTNVATQEWDAFFRYYGKTDGLPFEIYNQYAYLKTNDGKLLFGSQSGATVIDPANMFYNTVPPEVVFTEFSLFNKQVTVGDTTGILKRSITYAEDIILQPQQNIFSIEFSALNYIGSTQNKFQYMMEGFDRQWTETDYMRRSATYTQLPPGDYVFRVKASNNDGVWNEKGAAINIKVLPHWWQTWWFRLLMAAAVAAAVLLIIKEYTARKLRLQKTELEKQRAVENVRNRISRDIHDEVGSSLTKISLMSELLKSKVKTQDAEGIVNKITSSSRNVIGNMSEIIWATNPQHDNMASMIAYFRDYIAQFFNDTPIKCTVDFPEDIPETFIAPELRRNLFLVLKESLHNVLKHAGASEVCVEIKLHGKALEVLIKDNGTGFNALMPKKFSNGIKNINKRMEEVGGSIEIHSADGQGTEIKIKATIY